MTREMDVLVIGAGVAGLAAAIAAAGRGLGTLVIDSMWVGGHVNNMPYDVGAGRTGPDLVGDLLMQLDDAGAAFEIVEATAGRLDRDGRAVVDTAAGQIRCSALVIATGREDLVPGAEGTDALRGRGISTCAGCDAPLYRGKDVLLVGGGPYFDDELELVASHAGTVHVLPLGSAPDPLPGNARLLAGRRLVRVEGEGVLARVCVEDPGGGTRWLDVEGLITSGEGAPHTAWLGDLVTLDDSGLVVTDEYAQTSAAGVYAVGCVQSGAPGRVPDVVDAAAETGRRIADAIASRSV